MLRSGKIIIFLLKIQKPKIRTCKLYFKKEIGTKYNAKKKKNILYETFSAKLNSIYLFINFYFHKKSI